MILFKICNTAKYRVLNILVSLKLFKLKVLFRRFFYGKFLNFSKSYFAEEKYENCEISWTIIIHICGIPYLQARLHIYYIYYLCMSNSGLVGSREQVYRRRQWIYNLSMMKKNFKDCLTDFQNSTVDSTGVLCIIRRELKYFQFFAIEIDLRKL